MSFFHRFDADHDPEELLRPENQKSTPWGDSDQGPCDKCSGAGAVRYECKSCLEAGADPGCTACGGRVRFRDTCPACEGNGIIDRTTREGVSVFPGLIGLLRYLVERGDSLEGAVIIELDGERTGDLDLDADAGALLVRPTHILARHEIDEELVGNLRRRVGPAG